MGCSGECIGKEESGTEDGCRGCRVTTGSKTGHWAMRTWESELSPHLIDTVGDSSPLEEVL